MTRMARRGAFAPLILAVLFTPAWAQVSGVELQPIATGLSQPVFLTHPRDGSGRRFIVEQAGRILVMQPGSDTWTVFLDIRSRVLSGGERGLLGLAFHPRFAVNRRFLVNYTKAPDGATIVSEFTTLAENRNAADPNSESIFLTVPQPFANHNGGMIEFGPDGYLYIGLGDGGSGNDPQNRAQNLDDLLGKMLRIDVDRAAGGLRYSSPPTNPFFGPAPGRDEIFAYGLRNPWRFSFDRRTGEIYAGDVGQNAIEEIDIVTIGGNYGWRVFEGTRCTGLGPAACSGGNFVSPIVEYANGPLGRCSVTGGYVYRGFRASLPAGAYIFGDYCSGEIFMWKDGVQSLLIDTNLNISSFGEDESGELYVVAHGGAIFQIRNSDAGGGSRISFDLPGPAGLSVTPLNSSSEMIIGYGRIQGTNGSPAPGGAAILGLRADGVLISEAAVEAASAVRSGRIYAEVGGGVNTGVAVTNIGGQTVSLTFFLTDATGRDSPAKTITIPPGEHIGAFLDQDPFNLGGAVHGAFTFQASSDVAVMAIRGFVNERSEFLFATLPITPLSASFQPLTFPHYADGGGWTTEFVLVNPTDARAEGSLRLFGPSGLPANLTVNGQTGPAFPYSIAPRSFQRFSTAGAGVIAVGAARVMPAANSPAPAGIAVFRLRQAGVVVTETAVEATTGGSRFQFYIDLSTALRMGIAVANLSSAEAGVRVELAAIDGALTGLSAEMRIPGGGHSAKFVDELVELQPGVPFEGLLNIAADGPIAVTAIRGRVNERGEFIAAGVPVRESEPPASTRFIPRIVIGGGFDLQFVLTNSRPDATVSGTLDLFDRVGRPLALAAP